MPGRRLKRLKFHEYSEPTRDAYWEWLGILRAGFGYVLSMAALSTALISIHVPDRWQRPLRALPIALFLYSFVVLARAVRLARGNLRMMRAEREAATFGSPAPAWAEDLAERMSPRASVRSTQAPPDGRGR